MKFSQIRIWVAWEKCHKSDVIKREKREWKSTILRAMSVEPMQDLRSEDCIEDIKSKVPDRKSSGLGYMMQNPEDVNIQEHFNIPSKA